jgi:hypothetical protein
MICPVCYSDIEFVDVDWSLFTIEEFSAKMSLRSEELKALTRKPSIMKIDSIVVTCPECGIKNRYDMDTNSEDNVKQAVVNIIKHYTRRCNGD